MTEKNNDEKLKLAENVELLAPAGDMERLKYAIMYGADAVYFGSEEFRTMEIGRASCRERV